MTFPGPLSSLLSALPSAHIYARHHWFLLHLISLVLMDVASLAGCVLEAGRRKTLRPWTVRGELTSPAQPRTADPGTCCWRTQSTAVWLRGRDFTSEARFCCHSIGRCSVVCPHCNAFRWASKRTGGTVQQPLSASGAVQLQPLQAAPGALAVLLSSQTS